MGISRAARFFIGQAGLAAKELCFPATSSRSWPTGSTSPSCTAIPNYIPLSASAIERIVQAVEPFQYDRVYGAFWDMVIEKDGKAVVKRSAERYLRAIGR